MGGSWGWLPQVGGWGPVSGNVCSHHKWPWAQVTYILYIRSCPQHCMKELLSSPFYQWEGRLICTCCGVDSGHSGLHVNGPHCLNTWLLAGGTVWEVVELSGGEAPLEKVSHWRAGLTVSWAPFPVPGLYRRTLLLPQWTSRPSSPQWTLLKVPGKTNTSPRTCFLSGVWLQQ